MELDISGQQSTYYDSLRTPQHARVGLIRPHVEKLDNAEAAGARCWGIYLDGASPFAGDQ
ncbi:MAG: hypothetical protein AAF664_04685 [Planctomycetota bacterium]